MTGRDDGNPAAITPMRLSGVERLFRQSGLFRWQIRGAPRGLMRADVARAAIAGRDQVSGTRFRLSSG